MIKVKWKKIVYEKPVCCFINLGNGTMFRVIAFFTYNLKDVQRNSFFVGIERIGCFLFKLNQGQFYPDYVSEKLNIREQDAMAMCDWINTQCGFDFVQHGDYNINYLVDECDLNVIVPRIIGKTLIMTKKERMILTHDCMENLTKLVSEYNTGYPGWELSHCALSHIKSIFQLEKTLDEEWVGVKNESEGIKDTIKK